MSSDIPVQFPWAWMMIIFKFFPFIIWIVLLNLGFKLKNVNNIFNIAFFFVLHKNHISKKAWDYIGEYITKKQQLVCEYYIVHKGQGIW